MDEGRGAAHSHDLTTAPSSAPGLSLSGSVRFGARAVLDQVAFTAAAGAWTAVLGRSGVGKSTLLKAIAGLVATDATIGADDGRPIDGRVAWMAQADLIPPWMTAREAAAMGARLRGEALAPARVDAALAEVGLAHRAGARPDQLSGGERQRVALARTLLEARPIALLDEPFSALDAATRADLQELAWDRLMGRTVVLVTHDPLEAARLAHRAYILSDGGGLQSAPLSGAPLRGPSDPETIAAAAALTKMLRAS